MDQINFLKMRIKITLYSLLFILIFNQNVHGQSVTTVTLNPTADALVDNNSANINTNYGTSTTLEIGVKLDKFYNATVRRTFIQFNLSSIPSNAVIVSANLKLKAISEGTDVTNSSFVTQRVDPSSSQWIESGTGSITWANQPLPVTSDAIITSTYSSTPNHRIINVTAHLANIISGIYVNRGWVIKRNNETVGSFGSTYKSKEVTPTSDQPILEVQYYIPFSVSAASITHTSCLSASDGSITPTIINGPSSATYQWYNSSGLISGATNLTLSSKPYGWYGLKISGNQGNPEYMSFIIGTIGQSTTIPYNPGPNYIDDAKIGAFLQTLNQGSAKDINASKSQVISAWYNNKSLLKFNLWVDPSLTVNQATMKMYGKAHSYANSNASYLNKITSSWRENTVAWIIAPTSTTTNQISLATSTSSTQNYTNINTSSFWNDWKANNTSNYGMLLELQTTTNNVRAMNFHSSDTSNTSLTPQIDFIFFVNGTVAGTITPGASAICSGSTTVLTLSGYVPGATFQWEKSTTSSTSGFSPISGATASSYTTLGSTVVNTWYRCAVTVGSCSAVNSASQLITIKPVPTITVNDATFCSGNNVTLTATPSIGGGTYAWSTGGTTASINVAPLVNTNYTIIYTLNGCPSPIKTSVVTVCQQFNKLERILTGINYKVFAGRINFFFDQEYTSAVTTLTYKVYSVNNRTTPVMTGTSNSQSLVYGDNRYKLDVSSLSTGAFILEVENDKHELFYLRFIK
jgi:hypothetical protein